MLRFAVAFHERTQACQFRLHLLHFFVVFSPHRMTEFEHGEIQFEGGLGALFRKHIGDEVFHQLPAAMQQLFLYNSIILLLGYFHDYTRQLFQFGVGLHNGDGGMHGLRTFQNSGQHVETFFGEGFGELSCFLEFCGRNFRPQIRKFLIIKFKYVSIWEFFWVVAYRFINAFGFHSVQFGDITVEDYLLVAQGDLFCHIFAEKILISEFWGSDDAMM